jgi:hypothetical protein
MKRFLVAVVTIAVVLSSLSAAFAAKAPVEGAVLKPTVTSWYEYEGKMYLDTSINFKFGEGGIDIDEIQWIRFRLLDDDGSTLAQRFSSNKNLNNLFNDCAQYWGCKDYHDVTGERTLSCAFTARNGGNNRYWVSSGTDLATGQMPVKLSVQVKVGNYTYSCERIVPAE